MPAKKLQAGGRANCRLSGPEFATIAASGGMTSAAADIAIAATTE
jgi:hypothetical protein